MSTTEEHGAGRAPGRPRRSRGRRVPAWVVVPLAALAGYAGAGWIGLVLGGVAGIFLWRSRR